MPILTTLGAACARAWGFTSGLLKDPYFNLTSLLLPGNGTNGAQNNTFLDSSSNNFTITRNGNTTQGTFSPFSQTGWSGYFDGSNDYVSVADSSVFTLGTNAFTAEAWVYPTTSGTSRMIMGQYEDADNTGSFLLYLNTGNKLVCIIPALSITITGATNVPANAWSHVVITRSGSSFAIFLNGSRDASPATNSGSLTDSTYAFTLGADRDGNNLLYTGYIASARLVNGTAVYDPTQTSITVPTAPLTAITNTSLLTCQYNRFRDASSNNLTITANNGAAITPFSPFAPTQPYSASAVGGSGYFDGTGDYLEIASNTALQLNNTTAFTIEVWVYPRPISVNSTIITAYNPASPYQGYGIRILSGQFEMWDGVAWTAFGAAQINAWQHIAVSYEGSGTTKRFFLNGVQQGAAATVPSAINYTSGGISIGSGFDGYISGLRILKGTGYSSISIPTSPPTAITNTQLLLNFTNAGVVDATAKNVLETVGNAQISTTQSKWGGGSMSFNGTTDYMKSPASSVYSFGTGDWTIEFWYYQTAVTGTPRAFSINGIECPITTAGIGLYDASAALIAITGSSSLNTWSYYCACRVSGTIRLFKDGNLVGSVANSTNYNSLSYATSAGAKYNGADFFQGYLDDIRTSRYGRYVEGTGGNAGKMVFNGTNTLALPTAPFPVQ